MTVFTGPDMFFSNGNEVSLMDNPERSVKIMVMEPVELGRTILVKSVFYYYYCLTFSYSCSVQTEHLQAPPTWKWTRTAYRSLFAIQMLFPRMHALLVLALTCLDLYTVAPVPGRPRSLLFCHLPVLVFAGK